jgi:hypothetical protein
MTPEDQGLLKISFAPIIRPMDPPLWMIWIAAAMLPCALLGGWIDGVTGAGLAVLIIFAVVLTAAVIRGARESIREGRRRSEEPRANGQD